MTIDLWSPWIFVSMKNLWNNVIQRWFGGFVKICIQLKILSNVILFKVTRFMAFQSILKFVFCTQLKLK